MRSARKLLPNLMLLSAQFFNFLRPCGGPSASNLLLDGHQPHPLPCEIIIDLFMPPWGNMLYHNSHPPSQGRPISIMLDEKVELIFSTWGGAVNVQAVLLTSPSPLGVSLVQAYAGGNYIFLYAPANASRCSHNFFINGLSSRHVLGSS